MFDEQEFQKQFFGASYSDKFKKAYSGGSSGSRFPYLPTSKLENGTYSLRLLPPMPEKCPEGWLRVASHSILQSLGDEKPVRVECTFRGEDSPCRICEVLETLADEKSSLPTLYGEALEKARPISKLVLPVVLTAEPSSDGKYRPSKKEQGAMLEIYAATLQRKVATLFATDRYLNHAEKGRYIMFVKNHNQMDLVVPTSSEPGPMKDTSFMAPSSYPHVVNAHLKHLKKLSYEEQEKFLSTCFWMKHPTVEKMFQQSFYDDPTASEDSDLLPWE